MGERDGSRAGHGRSASRAGLVAGLAALSLALVAALAGCTPESLAKEVVANVAAWNIPNLAPKLTNRPILIITSDDGLAPSNDAFVQALHKAGNTNVTAIHMTTDHSYSDHRIALQQAVLQTLGSLQK